jgi:hypothetical protein
MQWGKKKGKRKVGRSYLVAICLSDPECVLIVQYKNLKSFKVKLKYVN